MCSGNGLQWPLKTEEEQVEKMPNFLPEFKIIYIIFYKTILAQLYFNLTVYKYYF